ncbi:DUF3592 domain-containing protein [Streptomyces sp. NPDC048270]|uniref:DUF3592 domain-containing protein n=1 Tax=Streptomyces sp. NPDC048270 TaxID=3154615 RepID=UPI0033FA1B21
MAETEPREGRLAAGLPAVAAGAVYGWAHWCFAGPAPPPTAVAWVGAVVLLVAACAGYVVAVGGSGSVFGGLLLAVGLLLTVAAADQTASRAESATCVVREVERRLQSSSGEGAPPAKTVYRLALDCPGGYPDELKDDRAVAEAGQEVRVAYDPRRRASPALEGTASPWRAVVWAVLLLAVSTVIAGRRGARDPERPAPDGRRPR